MSNREAIRELANILKDSPEALRQVRTEMYKRDFAAFIKGAWDIIEPGVPYSHNWHIDYLVEEVLVMFRDTLEGVYPDPKKYPDVDWDELDTYQRKLCVNVPTRSMKTLLISVFLPIWLLIHNPSIKIATVSYAEDIAIDINIKRRQILESEWFKEHFGHLVNLDDSDQTSKTMIETNKKGLLYTASIGGRFTGRGADVIILDDPQKPGEMGSPAERKKAIDFLKDTLPTRLNNQNTGVIIVIQQRLHTEDLTGYIEKNLKDVYRYVKIPLEFEKDQDFTGPITGRVWSQKKGEVLWPARIDRKSVKALRIALGGQNFAAQQQQNPTPDGSSLVMRQWFETARYEGTAAQWIQYQKQYRQEFFNTLRLVISIDSNYSTGKVSADKDAVGVSVIAFDHDSETSYVLEVKEYQWSFTQALARIMSYRERYEDMGFQDIVVLIETKANGGPILEVLQRNISGVLPFDPGMNDKEARLRSVTPRMESGNVKIPTDSNGELWLEPFLGQLLSFPYVDHDDMVDALSQSLIYLHLSKKKNKTEYDIYF